MYFKKEIFISFLIITISASNLYMPMIWLYLFLLDFLIQFLCDPDLQCVVTSRFVNFPGVKCVCLHDHEIRYLVVYEKTRGSVNWNQNHENPHLGQTSGMLRHVVLGPNATKTMKIGTVKGIR